MKSIKQDGLRALGDLTDDASRKSGSDTPAADSGHFLVACHVEGRKDIPFLTYVRAPTVREAERIGQLHLRQLEDVDPDTRIVSDLLVQLSGAPERFFSGHEDVEEIPRAITSADVDFPSAVAEWKPLSVWVNHPDFPVTDWRAEVANDDTRQSYVDWVNSKLQGGE